jgi:hypothetical protein
MSQSAGQTMPRVWGRIDLAQDFEVRYWARKLGVEEPKLREVVRSVGPIVENVRKHLEKTSGA